MDMIPNPAEMACIRAMPEMYRSIDARPDQMNTVIGCDPLNRLNPSSYNPIEPPHIIEQKRTNYNQLGILLPGNNNNSPWIEKNLIILPCEKQIDTTIINPYNILQINIPIIKPFDPLMNPIIFNTPKYERTSLDMYLK